MKGKQFIVIAMSPVGDGLSGGDRIFIELSRNASHFKLKTSIVSWKAGFDMCNKTDLFPSKDLVFIDLNMNRFEKLGFAVCYIARIVKAVFWSFSYNFTSYDYSSVVLYSASDFWMDVLPSFILKLRFPQISWVGTFYLAAPNPFKGYREEGKWQLPTVKGIVYFFMQLPMYLIIRFFSQFVFVTSEPDKKRFPKQEKDNTVIVIKGGVDLKKIEIAQKKIKTNEKRYDAVFQGRFHPQKGVLELLDIWKIVVLKKPDAKLVMIGDGPLMENVEKKILDLGLSRNIRLTGYLMDGKEKYSIFAQSKIVVHPAVYDSGGMSAAEAMAWGLPGVSFDLEALKTYYPKGILKVKIGDKYIFANTIVKLLSDKSLYSSTKKDALDLIEKEWNWEKRAQEVLTRIL